MRRTPALIAGGGPAGSAAAIVLAHGGMTPEVVERTTGPHDVVCGGFLGWDALGALGRLGVDAWALGARPIGRLRLMTAHRCVEVALPKKAAGLSRSALDEALLARAGSVGARIVRGRTVKAAGTDRIVRLDGDELIAADALFLATGKHELRGLPRAFEARSEPPAAGVRASLPAAPALGEALRDVIELHLFDGGYAGLLLQEDGSANLAISVARARLAGAGGPEALVTQIGAELPRLGDRIGDPRALGWTAVAGVPYGWRTGRTTAGIFRLGDQSAVIASLAGDGVAIALSSGIAAANAMLRDGPDAAAAYQRRFAQQARVPLAVAETLRGAAERPARRAALMRLAAVPALTRLAARMTRIG